MESVIEIHTCILKESTYYVTSFYAIYEKISIEFGHKSKSKHKPNKAEIFGQSSTHFLSCHQSVAKLIQRDRKPFSQTHLQ